jgi:hypothetical protein
MVQNEAENSASSAASQLERLALDIEKKENKKKIGGQDCIYDLLCIVSSKFIEQFPPFTENLKTHQT